MADPTIPHPDGPDTVGVDSVAYEVAFRRPSRSAPRIRFTESEVFDKPEQARDYAALLLEEPEVTDVHWRIIVTFGWIPLERKQ